MTSISEGQAMSVELLLHTKQQKTPISNQFWFQTADGHRSPTSEHVVMP